MNITYCFPTMQGEEAGQLLEGSEYLLSIYDLNNMLRCNYYSESVGDIVYLLEGQ